jgi:GMP synthase (glutamine-hydrolysing)
MRIYVIDNGGQWTHREWRVLKHLDADADIVPNTTPLSELKGAQGLVLSGGAPRVGLDASQMWQNAEYISDAPCPILGICAGHQFMALMLGGDAKPAKFPEFGKTQLAVDDEGDLFHGLPKAFEVWESHNDEVTRMPPDFTLLAHSRNCAIQAMKSTRRPLYGVQFHPEVEHTQHGYEIFKNFLRVCGEWK